MVEDRGSGSAGTLRAEWLKIGGVGEQGPSGRSGNERWEKVCNLRIEIVSFTTEAK